MNLQFQVTLLGKSLFPLLHVKLHSRSLLLKGYRKHINEMHNGAVLMEGYSGSTIHWLECPIVLHFTQVKWTVIISPSLD
jgi:hypothetical protein